MVHEIDSIDKFLRGGDYVQCALSFKHIQSFIEFALGFINAAPTMTEGEFSDCPIVTIDTGSIQNHIAVYTCAFGTNSARPLGPHCKKINEFVNLLCTTIQDMNRYRAVQDFDSFKECFSLYNGRFENLS
jgi:hypothetical protein